MNRRELAKKAIDKMSEDDKFSLFALSGCQTVVSCDDGRSFKRKTAHPCGIYFDGNQLRVVEAVNL